MIGKKVVFLQLECNSVACSSWSTFSLLLLFHAAIQIDGSTADGLQTILLPLVASIPVDMKNVKLKDDLILDSSSDYPRYYPA